MNQIYEHVFAVHPKARARDERLRRSIELIQFVSFKHLDLKRPSRRSRPALALAVRSLRAMASYRAPTDKLECISNACRALSAMLSDASKRSGGSAAAGADELLPMLIFAVIRANPPQLWSNLRFIGEYMRRSMATMEPGYVYTNVLSSIAFIKRVRRDRSFLSISEDEFQRRLKAAKVCGPRSQLHTHVHILVYTQGPPEAETDTTALFNWTFHPVVSWSQPVAYCKPCDGPVTDSLRQCRCRVYRGWRDISRGSGREGE